MPKQRTAAHSRLMRHKQAPSPDRAGGYLLRLERLLVELPTSDDQKRDARRLDVYLDLFFAAMENGRIAEAVSRTARHACTIYTDMLIEYCPIIGSISASDLREASQAASAALLLLRTHLVSGDQPRKPGPRRRASAQ